MHLILAGILSHSITRQANFNRIDRGVGGGETFKMLKKQIAVLVTGLALLTTSQLLGAFSLPGYEYATVDLLWGVLLGFVAIVVLLLQSVLGPTNGIRDDAVIVEFFGF